MNSSDSNATAVQPFPEAGPDAHGLLDVGDGNRIYPERVSAVVLVGVTMTRPAEIDWLYHGLARFLPGPWDTFRAGVPESELDGNLVTAYDHRMPSR